MSSILTAQPAPRPRHAMSWRLLVTLSLLVALVVVCVVSLAVGAKAIPLDQVWQALRSAHPSSAGVASENATVVRSLRIPRTLLGLGAGIALGVAGALMQGHTRNPLADPGLLGVSGGAGFMVVLSVQLLGFTGLYGYIWFGFAGALGASVLVFLLGSLGRGGLTPVTMALTGLVVSELLIALTSGVVLHGGDATLDAYRFWSVGSLAGRDPAIGPDAAPFLVAGLVLAALNAPALNALALGADLATGLGQNVRLARYTGLAAITLLTGAAVAACGQISFIGLAAPHLVRRIVGPDHRWLLPAAGLTGALLLLGADVLGRVVARPAELPVGIVLGLVGAPFFVALIRRVRQVRL